jgi:predicted metalloprotease
VRRCNIAILVIALAVGLAAGPAAAGGSGGGKGDPTLDGSDDRGAAKRTKAYKHTIAVAIGDLQAYWGDAFPSLYGDTYERVPSGRIIAARPGVALPHCQGHKVTYSDAKGNAFYCFRSNFVVYDDVGLFPELYRDFGPFAISLVLAHEWGHAIQDRAGNIDQPVILKELQADCFAGAWVSNVGSGGSALDLKGGELDNALAALLQFKDPTGTSADDAQAHGNAFDRVSAFSDGYTDGTERCASYFDSPPLVTELPFTDQTDLENAGNLPADEVLGAAVDSLNDFYTNVEPAYVPLTIDSVLSYNSSGPKRQLPSCGGNDLLRAVITNRVFYCDDGYFAFDEPYLQHVYDDIGDYGVVTLFANVWATYVESLQGYPGVDDNSDGAVLGADCYTGGFTAAAYRGLLLVDPSTGTPEFSLSPGDLDETIQAFLDYSGARGIDPSADVTFTRVEAFRTGFLDGYQVCRTTFTNATF